MNPITLAVIFAILSPILWAFMYVLDKYVLSGKVKRPLGYVACTGFVNLLFGLVLMTFLNWSEVRLYDLIFPLISGGLFGVQFYLYYSIIKHSDVSSFSGLVYFYPILVALLSFIFLGERLSIFGYIGLLLIIFGSIFLSIKAHKLHGRRILIMIGGVILTAAIYEFLIKIITNNIPEWNGVSLEFIFIGLAILCGLFFRNVRNDFKKEIKNIKWAFLTESFTFLAVATTFLAMINLKATIVSSIAAIQPLFILFFEATTVWLFGKLTKEDWKSKIIPIILIVVGVIILYSFEVNL